MISRLRGTIIERLDGYVVVNVSGVGYQVAVTEVAQRTLPKEVDLFVRLIVRDGEWELYGFESALERRVFDLLRSVSGVGPRTALALIGGLGIDPLARAVAQKDAKALTSVQGVGMKLAQRIVLELSEAMGGLVAVDYAEVESVPAGRLSDVEAALIALGFSRAEARNAAVTAVQESPSTSLEELIRTALAAGARVRSE